VWDKTGLSDADAYIELLSLFDASPASEYTKLSGSVENLIFTGIADGYEFAVTATWVDLGLAEPIFTEVTAVASRYPNGAVKVIFLMIDYDETIDNNLKHIRYSYKSEHDLGTGNFNWHPMGKLLFHTSDDDLISDDRNMLETLILRNTGNSQIKVIGLIAS
jgi:hypothetical protein